MLRSNDDLDVFRSHVLQKFFERVYRSGRVSKMIIVSPWISNFRFRHEVGHIDLDSLFFIFGQRRATFYIVTRTPQDDWHQAAIDKIEKHRAAGKQVSLKFRDDLHAKIFYADVLETSLCLIGSPNLTARSDTNSEIGLMLRGSPSTRRVLQDIRGTAMDIYHTSRATKRGTSK